MARLEQEGYIQMFTQRLRDDPRFREEFLAGHRTMMARRLELARRVCPSGLPEEVEKILTTATIAGSRHPFGVKCLHAHLAQTLVDGNNPIGALVLQKIGPCLSGRPCLPDSEGGFPE